MSEAAALSDLRRTLAFPSFMFAKNESSYDVVPKQETMISENSSPMHGPLPVIIFFNLILISACSNCEVILGKTLVYHGV